MMKTLKWIPALVVIAILIFAAVRYRETLLEWFDPVLGPIMASLPRGATEPGVEAPSAEIGPFEIAVEWAPMPPQPGANTVHVRILDQSGAAVEGALVTVATDDTVPLKEIGPGLYATEVDLAMAGDWEILGHVATVDMRHSDFKIELRTGIPEVRVSAAAAGPAGAAGESIAYWTCSMHPSVKSQRPGTCPICAMDLVPVSRREIETGVITVDARRRQLIGVETGIVRRERLDKEIRTVGSVVPAEPNVADVTLKFEAWIGEVYADFEGKHVQKGQPLFTFYSPELWTAQEEYLSAYRRRQENPTRKNRLVEAAETRLKLWGISDAEVAAMRERGAPIEYLPYASPVTGTVLEKNVVEGTAVKAGQLLYRVADLSTVWIEAEIYEHELSLVEEGQQALITLSYLPEVEVLGTVSYVYPYLDPETRTARIRFEAPNPDLVLKPAMYTNVALNVPLGERLVVPEDAVIYAGETRVAFVDLGEGRLEPRRIKTGVRTDEGIEVLEGLEAGERIVTSANFLIAAESKLKSGIEKW